MKFHRLRTYFGTFIIAGAAFISGQIWAASIDEEALAKTPPQEFQRIVERLDATGPEFETTERIGIVFKIWTRIDAAAAFAGAVRIKSLPLRTKAFAGITRATDSSKGKALVVALCALPPEVLPMSQRAYVLTAPLVKWTDADPAGAAAYLETISPRGPDYYMVWSQVAEHWAAKDAPAALRWAEAQRGNELGNIVLYGAISGWWEKEPASAESYVFARLDTFEGQRMLAALTKDMFHANPEKAIRWVTQIPDVQSRRESCAAVGVLWAHNDPKAASTWALSLPADLRGSVLTVTLGAWSNDDPQSAGQWLTQLEGEGRDAAVDAYSAATTSTNPATAMQWAETIAEPSLRQRVMKRVASLWRASDADAMAAWIQSSGLPQNEQGSLLSAGSTP